jgi:transcriptional regulator with XRE-family HTH domain
MKNKELELVEFAARLKKVRLDKGLTQLQLGELSGISKVQITRYEKAITKPTPRSVKKLSDALNVKYEIIAGGFFNGEDDLVEFDASIERLKRLPKRDIFAIKEIIDCYVGFKELTSSVNEIVRQFDKNNYVKYQDFSRLQHFNTWHKV